MNLAAARAAIAAIAKFCPHDEWRLQAIEALEYLDGEDEPGPTPGESADDRRRRLARDRKRKERDTKRDGHAGGHAPVTPERDMSRGQRDAGASRDLDLDLSLPQSSQDLRGSRSLDPREPEVTPGHAGGHAPVTPERDTPRPPGRRPAVNAADDGVFGFAVESWRQGVREATGRPITLSLGVVRHLVDVILDNCPDDAQREAWAHEKAAAWAKACKAAGVVLNPHKFADWIASDEQLSSPRSAAQTSAESPEQAAERKRRLDESQRKRDEEHERYAREARGPLPGELTGALERPGVKNATRRTA